MVGIVIVSHSRKLAEAVVELTAMMAPEARITAAGGLEDGSFGTSFERIQRAVEELYSEDGVMVLMDMGSAVMTTEMVIEALGKDKVAMADAPIVEGAVAATVSAVGGSSLEELLEEMKEVAETKKIQGDALR
ncbi:MAG: dihydroxyacetone kinase phosphoryl donor subunit DhaM [Stomatobaculum sp.]